MKLENENTVDYDKKYAEIRANLHILFLGIY